jgi:hypothetical protein
MFAFITTLEETLRADLRRARLWADRPSNSEALECASHLAERIGATEVCHLLRTALRHPQRRALLIELAQERMGRTPDGDQDAAPEAQAEPEPEPSAP